MVLAFAALVGCGGFLSLSGGDEDEAAKNDAPKAPSAGLSGDATAPEGAEGGVVVDASAAGPEVVEPIPEPSDKTHWRCGLDGREYAANNAECNATLSMRGCWAIGVPRDEECVPEDASAGAVRIYCDPCSMVVNNQYTFASWLCTCK